MCTLALHASPLLRLAPLALVAPLAGCQIIAGLTEDRPVVPIARDASGGSSSSPSNGGAGGEGGEGGSTAPTDGIRCEVLNRQQASQDAYGNAALAYFAGRYDLAWPNFSSGIQWNSVDKFGGKPNAQDQVLLGADPNYTNTNIALIPYMDGLLVGTSRHTAGIDDTAAGTNTPTLLKWNGTANGAGTMGTAPAFDSGHAPEVASLVATADASRVLMVLRAIAERGPTDLRLFNPNLAPVGEASIPETWDASAAWAENIHRFGVFYLKEDSAKTLYLRTFLTDGGGATDAVINIGDEYPELSYFQHSLSAAATPDRFYVAWTDERKLGDQQVYLTGVDALGGRLTDSVWVSDQHPDVSSHGAPTLLFDGAHLVVTWRDERTLYFRRYTTALEPYGEELELTELNAGGTEQPALAASAPGQYAIAYMNQRDGTHYVFQRIVCDDP